MTTVNLPSGLRPASPAPCPRATVVVRAAGPEDAGALYRLSRVFVRTGELCERPPWQYARDAGDFLIAESPMGGVEGCVALRCGAERIGPASARTAVLYNFCVAARSQGRGVGSALLRALLAEAVARPAATVFTATSGGAELFLRHGFTPAEDPAAWPAALNPRRGSRVLRRAL
ncbi:GNAT family N-acetyltransferase [Streptomyces sp. M41]|uniref:GNAT family N-acetyltransferase n=1 Tax=Streptomyces sp. M41 TaxID=3059412 RepID=UPI00374CDDBB